jgi:microcystin-dependent protein
MENERMLMRKNRLKKENGLAVLEISLALSSITAMIAASLFFAPKPQTSGSLTETIAALLEDLQDIDITNPKAGDALVWDGSKWVNGILNLSDLGSTNIINPSDGDVLMFDGEKWYNSTPAPPTVENLVGVVVSNPQNGQTLVWNGTSWINGTSGISGEVKLWSTSTAPEGWLIADGREVSRTTYAELFAEIGTTFGTGNGTTTFNLPDLRGNIPVGLQSTDASFNAIGKTGGSKAESLTIAQMASHTHIQNSHTHSGSSSSAGGHTHSGTVNNGGAHTHTGSTNTAGSHNGTFPTGDGANTGYNLRTVGCCSNRGQTAVSSNYYGNQLAPHSHALASIGAGGDHAHTATLDSGAGHAHTLTVTNATATNGNTGGGGTHSNLQPYLTVNYIIKQ